MNWGNTKLGKALQIKSRWMLLILAVALALLLSLLPRARTGLSEKTGYFNWIERDEDGVSFIISP